MGYSIYIGNAEPEFSKEDGELYARWAVKRETSPDAPTFPHDEVTGQGNCRSPSYSGWADFCREAGLYDLFFDKWGGLMSEHPGCKPILPEHLLQVQAALVRAQRNATRKPGFEGWPQFNEETKEWDAPDRGKYDATLARLMWLEFWMRRALEKCETPAIHNT